MKKYSILFLLSALCLTSCGFYSDSFHKEFYYYSSNSYLTFSLSRKIKRNTPGSGNFADFKYEEYLDFYFNDNEEGHKLKELTYKKRDGYVAIYLQVNAIEQFFLKTIFDFDVKKEINSQEFKDGLGIYTISRTFNGLNKFTPFIRDAGSRYIFRDFDTLSDKIYKNRGYLSALISYVDVYDGDNKLFTTYYHYSLDSFEPVNFYEKLIYLHSFPPDSPTKTLSIFPYEGNFLNYYYQGELEGNFFSNKYLNTYFPVLNENYKDSLGISLSSFRFEIINEDQKYILLPKYAIDENPSSWGKYLDTINNYQDSVVNKTLDDEIISYIKVPLTSLKK